MTDRRCPECEDECLILDDFRGEITCSHCGLVLEAGIIDHDMEFRIFDESDVDKLRTGPPTSLMIYDKGVSTDIGRENAGRMSRLRKWDQRTRTGNIPEKGLTKALMELDRIASQLKLTRKTKEQVAHLYRLVARKQLIRGRSAEAMIIASIYAVCRLNELPFIIDDFLHLTNISKRRLSRCYKTIMRVINKKAVVNTPMKFLIKFCAELKLPPEILERAMELIKRVEKRGLTMGKSPTGIAGAIVYICVLEQKIKLTQREIAEVAKVSEATLRNRYKDFMRHIK